MEDRPVKVSYDDEAVVLLLHMNAKQKKDSAAFIQGLVKGIEIGQVLKSPDKQSA
jgi:hypothetical protein